MTQTTGQLTGQIVVDGLTKRFGDLVAVNDLHFTVEPGRITGFLGPNGAGKTTTMRMLLGLISPSAGTATIGGLRYAELPNPTRVVGAALEATSFHPGRTGRNHLRVLADAAGMPTSRADELLDLVGLTGAERKRVGGYSLGMRQRLGLAAALIGDPQVLILDEPANGLDPEGIYWLRGFLRHLAGQGRTLLVSSHMLSEIQHTVDDVVVIVRGANVRSGSIASLAGPPGVRVRTSDPAGLERALQAAGLSSTLAADGSLTVRGGSPVQIGDAALAAGLPIHELTPLGNDLESLYFSLTGAPGGSAIPAPGPTMNGVR